MFDIATVADLTASAACEAVVATQAALREHEWRELVLAAHWAVLHGPESVANEATPGAQRLRRAGGEGTPDMAEFACAELGALMGTSPISADNLLRDAVDLRHRHPLMWAALAEGRSRVWKGRRVARLVGAAGLSLQQAWFVDAATTPYVDSLPWSAFVRLVEAGIIEADPAAADARRRSEALRRFVTVGRDTDLELDHGLKTLVARAGAGDVLVFVAVCDRIAQILALTGDRDPVDARRSKAIGILANPAAALALLQEHATDEPHPADPDRSSVPSEQDDGLCASCGGPRVDADLLRPRAVLHVRMTDAALGCRTGVAACEGVGPVTVEAVAELVGHHRVTVRPVLDQRDQIPVDAYEIPAAMREALLLSRPSSVFPWSSSTGPDVDHTVPYISMDDGGPPGQTGIHNLGPLDRFGHRVKTHAPGWHLDQPTPGVYLWRSPHGYRYRVDADGSHPLGCDPDLDGPSARPPLRLVRSDA